MFFMIKLNSNESPFGPSPKAIAAMQAAVEHGNRYPDDNATELRDHLAALHRVRPEQVLVTAGLTDFLGILCRALLNPGLNAVTSQRSFIVYSIATKASGAPLIEVPMQNDALDMDAIAAAIDDRTRIVFVANPNNPTGTVLEASAIDGLLDRVSEQVTVVIDEAYYDYANYFAQRRAFRYSHSEDYVRENRNVLILRTFSKVHGLAGLRVAYALGRPDTLKSLARMRSTFSISGAAQAGAIAALDDQAHVRRALDNNGAGAARLTTELATLGYPVPQTWANFVYCELHVDARTFAKTMEGEGVSIRALSAWGAPQAIRVTIGTEPEMDLFLAAFRNIADQRPRC
jgi:histidinol-phosphate aminotransferase